MAVLPAGSIDLCTFSVLSFCCHKDVATNKSILKDIGSPKGSHDFGKEMHR